MEQHGRHAARAGARVPGQAPRNGNLVGKAAAWRREVGREGEGGQRSRGGEQRLTTARGQGQGGGERPRKGGTYSADFQKCPGWDRRRFRFGSFSSMSMSLVKEGLSSCSKAQQKRRMS